MNDFSYKVTTAELQRNGKYSIAIELFRHTDEGHVYRHSTVTSPGLFETTEAAFEAGKRAISTVVLTGRFPNMCEPF